MNSAIKYNKFADNNILNSIRRVLINEIHTWTFDNIQFKDFNSSVYNTEYIIQRLRLIPLIQENIPEKVDDIKFICNVVNNTNEWKKVVPNDLKCSTLSTEKIIRKEILMNLPIIYLPPNESIKFSAELKKDNAYGYNKYCHSWYDDEYFYVESIDKCNNTDKAITKAINYLVKECNKIKEYTIKNYNNVSITTIKLEMNYENVSRSALNIIIQTLRDLLLYITALTKWYREGNNGQNFPFDSYKDMVSPDDFITAVIQPHMSENKYRVFLDIKSDYIPVTNDASEYQEKAKSRINITNMFKKSMKQQGIDLYENLNHNGVQIFVETIDYVIKKLNNLTFERL